MSVLTPERRKYWLVYLSEDRAYDHQAVMIQRRELRALLEQDVRVEQALKTVNADLLAAQQEIARLTAALKPYSLETFNKSLEMGSKWQREHVRLWSHLCACDDCEAARKQRMGTEEPTRGGL